MRLSLCLFSSLALTLLLPATAQAACPGIFNGLACNGGTGSAVCTTTLGSVTCDLAITANTSGADAIFVSPSTTSFRAYGYEGDGEAFCCEFTGIEDGCFLSPIDIEIYGTTQADIINLNDFTAGLSLGCSETIVHGRDLDDTIVGSDLTTNLDFLYGDANNDTIDGLDGDDYLDGGTEDDVCDGGDGADDIYGGDGNDDLYGGDHADVIYGGIGNDDICGEGGIDDQHGEGGDDTVYGGPANDIANDGEAGANDWCESDASVVGCDTIGLTVCMAG